MQIKFLESYIGGVSMVKINLLSVEELEDVLNEAMRLRAKYNDLVIESLQEACKRGLTVVWDNDEFSGKYYKLTEENDESNIIA